ncbi:uncharacterized protein TRIADDRAFT_51444 [Trichoplax adhaerens]|uniref:Uncharacterized protein n=1 Tax=Trichoplax adhaerens TaxID=10228 RepID=B3RJ83_TRIAD|nr:hypothetical protein TRIADDRAFT_51444 [Trichoplax adhaerens]EDV29284.1 hypothetical protein TRIADDRAFT_51444 [Trichoplax adhaerens]|eukprot:XP_002108486.1 hypothetical protein TRIADDRAFT_51444 [Trichoplax adhaerens]
MNYSSSSSSFDDDEVAPDPALLIQRQVSTQWDFTFQQFGDKINKIATKCIQKHLTTEIYDQAMRDCHVKLQHGDDSHSHYLLGYYFHHGYSSIGIDKKQSEYHYNQAAQRNHLLAYYGLFQLDRDKIIQSDDQHLDQQQLAKKHANNLIKAAAFGLHSDAIQALRSLYRSSQDWRQEINQFREQNYETIKQLKQNTIILIDSYNCLGFLEYLIHKCNTLDQLRDQASDEDIRVPAKSFDYFKKASQLGDPRGDMNYAFYTELDTPLCHGNEVSLQELDQIKHYHRAVLRGCPLAAIKLKASMRESRNEVRNILKHRYYVENYIKALPYSDVYNQLGSMHFNAGQPFYIDIDQGKDYFFQAIVNPPSMAGPVDRTEYFYLGLMYEFGIGVQANITTAAHFYASSIYPHHDISLALCRLAKLIEKGKLSQCNINDAVQLYQYGAYSHATQVAPYCHYRLGRIIGQQQYQHLSFYQPVSVHLHMDIAFSCFNEEALLVKPAAMDRYVVSKLMEDGSCTNTSSHIPVLAPQRNFYITRAHFTDNYLNRFYSIKAWLRGKILVAADADNAKLYDQLNWLNKEIKTLWGYSPIQLMMEAYQISQRYYSKQLTVEHFRFDFQCAKSQLQDKPNAATYYKLGLLHQYGLGGAVKDFKLSAEYYSQAAELYCPMASINLSFLYGCEEDGDCPQLYYQVFTTARELATVQLQNLVTAALNGSIRAIDIMQDRLKAYSCWRDIIDERIKDLTKCFNKKILGFINKRLSNTTSSKYHAEMGILLMVKELNYKMPDQKAVKEILKHLEESMKLGNPAGTFLYAFTKLKLKLADNKMKYINLYHKAAELNHPGANRMFFIHCNTNNSKCDRSDENTKDDEKKASCVTNAANFGFPDAMADLAITLKYQGPKNVELARQLLHQSISDKLLGCYRVDLPIAELGLIYQYYWSSSNHYELAAHYYAIDAFYQMEDAKSRCYLAKLIIHDHIKAKNKLDDAIKLCQSAIYIQDNCYSAYAHYLLGKIYSRCEQYSNINSQNMANEHYNSAFQLFYRNHSHYSSTSCMSNYYLGVMCQFGCGRRKDLNKAKQFYSCGLRCKCKNNVYFIKHYLKKCQNKLDMLKDSMQRQ